MKAEIRINNEIIISDAKWWMIEDLIDGNRKLHIMDSNYIESSMNYPQGTSIKINGKEL